MSSPGGRRRGSAAHRREHPAVDPTPAGLSEAASGSARIAPRTRPGNPSGSCRSTGLSLACRRRPSRTPPACPTWLALAPCGPSQPTSSGPSSPPEPGSVGHATHIAGPRRCQASLAFRLTERDASLKADTAELTGLAWSIGGVGALYLRAAKLIP